MSWPPRRLVHTVAVDPSTELPPTAEHARLAESPGMTGAWRMWGPYLAGRQWGTVREDYSPDGNPWASFPFEHARARAYRWGEDGLGGVSDRFGFLNFAVALWNRRDPILKERLFGLTNNEGNHGEDAKEYWWVIDGTPTHSWMQWRYRYPQAEYPYQLLREENARRGRDEREFELADTGVLEGDRFFDVDVMYAKAAPDDLCITISATNHGPDPAPLDLLPQAWLRNTWAWGRDTRKASMAELRPPELTIGGLDRRPRRPRVPRAVLPRRRGAAGGALLRQRDERRRAVRGRGESHAVHQGRDRPPHRARGHGGGQPGEHRHQGRVPLLVRRRGAGRDGRRAPAAVAGGTEHRHVRTRVRHGRGRPPPRGRRVLRPRHRPRPVGRRPSRRPPGLRRPAVDQAAVPLRRRPVAVRRPRSPAAEPGPAHPRRPQHRLDAPVARRRHLDARRVGVPVVRRLGPRLPHRAAGPRRSRVRQGTVGADVPGVGDAPERPAPRLRMGVRRRQPAGVRLGDLARVPPRRHARPHVPRPRVQQAAPQLLVVGEPQGLRGLQPVRGRLPRHGQHRRVQPLGAAATRIPPGAVRRDELDGLLLHPDVQDRRGAVARTSGRGTTSPPSSSSTSSRSPPP